LNKTYINPAFTTLNL